GRFVRKSFAQEIERELRMLEEFVMTDDVSDDVGENLMVRDEDFEPPEVPFQPKPTSVSIIAAASDFSSESNFTTMPKAGDIHQQHPVLRPPGRGRASHPPAPAAAQPAPPPPRRSRTQPPVAPPAPRYPAHGRYDEELHSAPTMIIDIRRVRGRG